MHEHTTVAKAELNKACIEFAVKVRHETAKMGIVIQHWVQPYTEVADTVHKPYVVTRQAYANLGQHTMDTTRWEVHANRFPTVKC